MSATKTVLAAIMAALKADAPYMALIGSRIYDGDAPEGTAFPYTVLGDETEILNAPHDKDGYSHSITIHDFSLYDGRSESLDIRAARNAVLHNALVSPVGWDVTTIRYDFGDVLVEWDPELKRHVRHQVTRYRVESLEQ